VTQASPDPATIRAIGAGPQPEGPSRVNPQGTRPSPKLPGYASPQDTGPACDRSPTLTVATPSARATGSPGSLPQPSSAHPGLAQHGSARPGSAGSHAALTPRARALCHHRLRSSESSPRHDGAACTLARRPQLPAPLQRRLRDRPDSHAHSRSPHHTAPAARHRAAWPGRPDTVRPGRPDSGPAGPSRCSHAHLRASTHSHYRLRMPLDAVDTGRDCWPELSNPAGP
jgi:hypothetical protein